MDGPDRPEATLLVLAGLVFCALGIWRLICWIKDSPVHPDPWDAETERHLHEPNATPVCHRCFTPCPPLGWFCENCGCAVGPYNNLMPYVQIFSEGEVLRNGLDRRIPATFMTVAGYFLVYALLSLNMVILIPLLPVYLFRLVKNWLRQRHDDEDGEEPVRSS